MNEQLFWELRLREFCGYTPSLGGIAPPAWLDFDPPTWQWPPSNNEQRRT
jgi:hypothetical protein